MSIWDILCNSALGHPLRVLLTMTGSYDIQAKMREGVGYTESVFWWEGSSSFNISTQMSHHSSQSNDRWDRGPSSLKLRSLTETTISIFDKHLHPTMLTFSYRFHTGEPTPVLPGELAQAGHQAGRQPFGSPAGPSPKSRGCGPACLNITKIVRRRAPMLTVRGWAP